jgi:ABC-type glycerol-3-phosphate transport system substrate-binding protein
MAINLDLMKEIGFTVKPDWTIKDFLYMAELVKQKYGGKKWATGMFAANQSGDYLINNWFESFGVKWYEGNYDKATISKNGGAKVYEFYQTLVKNGYVPPNSAMLTDDDYVIQWAKGDLAATAFFPAWAAPYFDTVIKQGLVKGKFNYAFMPFPRADGVKKVGTYYNGSVAIVRKTGTSVDKVAARFVEYLNDIVTENLFAELGNPPDKIKGNKPSDPHTAQVSKIIETEGIADWGLSDRRFTERRALQYPILQQVLNLKVSPDEAIRKFDAALSAVK